MDNKIVLQQNTPDRQAGVSLMLAVLVLSAVTAIAFSLTTIVFIELRAATDIVRGEPALYATLGMTEQALFQYKRYVNGPDQVISEPVFDVTKCVWKNASEVASSICKIGSVDFTSKKPVLREYEEVPKLVTVYNGSTVSIPLHDGSTYKNKYSKVEVQLVPIGNNSSLQVQIWRMDPKGVATTSYKEFTLTNGDGPGSGDLSCEACQFELRLIAPSQANLSSNTAPKNFLVSITTYDTQAVPQKLGIPYVGKRALDVVANYLGVNRTYRVYIPVP